MTLEKVEFVENDYEHKIARLDAIEAEVQKILDYLSDPQKKFFERGLSSDQYALKKEEPVKTPRTTSETACETLITSANFDFDNKKSENQALHFNNFFQGCKEVYVKHPIGNFDLDVPLTSPQSQSSLSNPPQNTRASLMNRISIKVTEEAQTSKLGEPEAKPSKPVLNMLEDLEAIEDRARSEISGKASNNHNKKKPNGFRLIQLKKSVSETTERKDNQKPPTQLRLKPLDDSWDDPKVSKVYMALN